MLISRFNDSSTNNKRKRRLDVIYSILLWLIVVCHFNLVMCKSLEPILWSIQNKMFETKQHRGEWPPPPPLSSSRGEHTIEVRIGEFLNILCPKYALNSANTIEYHALHKVSKEEFNACKIREIHAKHPILRCDRPFENVKYTLYIAKFSPVPDALEFVPGNSYYFISTSNGTYAGLNNHENGTCLTNNMRLIIKVLDAKAPSRTTTTTPEPVTTISDSKSTSSTTVQNEYAVPNNNENSVDNYYDYLMRKKQLHSTVSSVLITKLRSVTFNPNSSTKVLLESESSTSTPTPAAATKTTKTVNDNIFILEPDTIDYNDILSQLIFSSSTSQHSSLLSSPPSQQPQPQPSSLNSETNSDERDDESESELFGNNAATVNVSLSCFLSTLFFYCYYFRV